VLLNEKEQDVGWQYRLPKELEWEYACRGGPLGNRSQSAFDFYLDKPTNELQPEQANFNRVLKRTCKVGSYKPNRLGLYDMHGNVWEWCDDLFDPKDPARASHRVHRGGGWQYDSGSCGAAFRSGLAPSYPVIDLGLRLARVPSAGTSK
jgi:formylglycine-generating enzyme required for sulfatase activity